MPDRFTSARISKQMDDQIRALQMAHNATRSEVLRWAVRELIDRNPLNLRENAAKLTENREIGRWNRRY